jgi:hypothetical protein
MTQMSFDLVQKQDKYSCNFCRQQWHGFIAYIYCIMYLQWRSIRLTGTLFVVQNNLMCMIWRNVRWEFSLTLYLSIQLLFIVLKRVVNSDDCHSNTNKTSSVLFISTLNVVDYSTLNAGVQCINDMQMIKETERRKDKIRLLFHYSYMYTYCDERRETETERRLTLFLSRITDWTSSSSSSSDPIYRQTLLIYRLIWFLC